MLCLAGCVAGGSHWGHNFSFCTVQPTAGTTAVIEFKLVVPSTILKSWLIRTRAWIIINFYKGCRIATAGCVFIATRAMTLSSNSMQYALLSQICCRPCPFDTYQCNERIKFVIGSAVSSSRERLGVLNVFYLPASPPSLPFGWGPMFAIKSTCACSASLLVKVSCHAAA